MHFVPVRRIVTAHDRAGRAVVHSDAFLPSTKSPHGDAEFTLVWTTAEFPVNNDDDTDGRERETGLTMPGGSVLRVVDLLPGRRSEMHRTNSLDYGIVMDGAVELELDDGHVVSAPAGAIIVQRGTIHAWRNPSTDTVARIAFVLLDAKPATTHGNPLQEVSARAGLA